MNAPLPRRPMLADLRKLFVPGATLPSGPVQRPSDRTFHRSTIPHNEAVAPYELEGIRRVTLLSAWSTLVAGTGLGLAYTAWTHPLWLLIGLPVAYVGENLLFTVGHVGLHASFVEMEEQKMATLTHMSFLHHCRRLRVYHEHWLETRLSYFVCPRKGFTSVTTLPWGVVLPAAALSVASVSVPAAVAALSCLVAMRLLQSLVHEWYHCNVRETFYWPVTRWFLQGLEAVGILSTRGHMEHHKHHLHNLDGVENWVDMALPGADRIGDALWARVLERHVPGELRMVQSAARVLMAWLVFHCVSYAGVFVVLSALLP